LANETAFSSISFAISRVELSSSELENFALFDCSRGYTRNLIATDHKSFTLLLLCWTPGKFSPIHDHPCDGCWMKVLEGQVQEYRYKESDVDGSMECIQDMTCRSGQVLYIEDSMGLHKVGNPSATERAVTLHVYSPPFAECKIWLDEDRSPNRVTIQHFSEYGMIL
jgi:cysteine dioxygenase